MPTDKKEQKEQVLTGTIVFDFSYKKKQYYAGKEFKTKDQKLFRYLLTTKRIVK